MAKKRNEKGQFEAATAEIEPGTPEAETKRVRRVAAPRPKYCRTYARARFAEALPEISLALLEQAKKGSVAHLKLLMHLTGLDKADVVPRAMKKRGKGLEAILQEQWRKDDEARAVREAEAEAEAAEIAEAQAAEVQ